MATLRPLHREEFGNELFLDGARPRSEHVAVRRSSNLRSRYQPLPAHLAQAGRAHVVLRSRVSRGRARGQVSAPTGLPTRPRYLSAWLVVHLQGGCRALPRGEGSPGTEVCAEAGPRPAQRALAKCPGWSRSSEPPPLRASRSRSRPRRPRRREIVRGIELRLVATLATVDINFGWRQSNASSGSQPRGCSWPEPQARR